MSIASRVSTKLAAVALLAGSAQGASVSSDIFTIEVSSSLGTGSFTANLVDAIPFPDFFLWQLPSSIAITDTNTNTVLGSLVDARVIIDDQPGGGLSEGVRIGLSYTFQAAGADTDLVVSSGVATFAAIPDAEAYASAGMPMTDNSQDGNATAAGGFGNGAAFRATFNGSNAFADLLTNPVSVANPGGSNDDNDENGTAGSPIGLGQSVTSISTEFRASITAGDSVGGTSVFAVVPSPATSGLLALGGLVAARRRR